jgi:hypothetical protein
MPVGGRKTTGGVPGAHAAVQGLAHLWLDWTCFSILMHPPWSQGVNFDALITFCACSTQKVPQAEKRFHMQFPIALELFTQTFLIGSINRA